eukprot:54394-Alexandrium_andersonii.AAC.1
MESENSSRGAGKLRPASPTQQRTQQRKLQRKLQRMPQRSCSASGRSPGIRAGPRHRGGAPDLST